MAILYNSEYDVHYNQTGTKIKPIIPLKIGQKVRIVWTHLASNHWWLCHFDTLNQEYYRFQLKIDKCSINAPGNLERYCMMACPTDYMVFAKCISIKSFQIKCGKHRWVSVIPRIKKVKTPITLYSEPFWNEYQKFCTKYGVSYTPSTVICNNYVS